MAARECEDEKERVRRRHQRRRDPVGVTVTSSVTMAPVRTAAAHA